MRKATVVALLAMLMFSLLAGCTEITPEKATTPEGSVPATTSPAAPPTTPVFTPGETVRYGDLYITVHGLRTSKGGGFITPDHDFFLLLDLTIENRGAKAAAISSMLSMHVIDAEGYKHDVAIFADNFGNIDGQLGAGRRVRGEVGFDVPKHDTYEFIFSEPFAVGQAIWRLEHENAGKPALAHADLGPPQTATLMFKVGDSVKFGDLVLTVNSFRTSRGQGFMTPDEDQFVIVNLTIENKGSRATAISTMLQMELVDAEWYKYDVAMFADTKGSLDGEVGPGRSIRGEVGFDVRRHDKYEFIFLDPFASGQAIWVLK